MEEDNLNLEDVGTRYKHLVQLRELWETGLEILNRYNFYSDQEQKLKLTHAIQLLNKHLDTRSNYDYRAYSLRDSLNSIPKDASSIRGGRGTPLSKEFNAKKGKQP